MIRENNFVELPVTARHVTALGALAMHHRDPFDRMLIVQARVEGYTLVTADRTLGSCGLPLVDANQ